MSRLALAQGAISAWIERWSPRGVFLASFLAFLVLRGTALVEPPYWDALLGAFPQAIWSADHGLSLSLLLRDGGAYTEGGACVYPFSIYPWSLAVLYALDVPPTAIFVAYHVLSFACAAGVLAGVFALARPRLGALVAAWCVVALACWPLFQSLACQINMDMPLTACGVAALLALVEGRVAAAWCWTCLALLVKPTGVVLVGAQAAVSALALLAPRAFGFEPAPPRAGDPAPRAHTASRRDHALALAGYVLLGVVFLVQLRVLERAGTTPRGIEWFSGFAPLFTRRLWYMPEIGLATLLALLAAGVALARCRRTGLSALETATACFVVVFVGFYGQYTNVLPRYFLQAAPFLVLLLVLACAWNRALLRGVPLALGAIALFGLVNARGRLYPAQAADDPDPQDGQAFVASNGQFLERSLEYRDDLDLARSVVRGLERFDRAKTVVVANWPYAQLLSEPRLGYVDRAFRTASAETTFLGAWRPVAYEALYRHAGERTRKNVEDDVLWIVSPNVFAGGSSRFLPGVDEIVERFAVGRLRAYLLHRRGWE